MKKMVALCLAELSLVGAGIWVDRVFPYIPTWALGALVVVAMLMAAALWRWSLRDEETDGKMLKEAILRELREPDYRIDKLRETAHSLPQKPLGKGHTYAELPEGTNIVTLADGSIRLALPVRISGRGSAHITLEPVTLTKETPKGDTQGS